MSYLSTALTDALQRIPSTQSALADEAKITHSQVNRACRGTVSVGAETIHAIVRALPVEFRGPVLAAWLKDQLSPDLLKEVEIQTPLSRAGEKPTQLALPDELDPETRSLIVWLANRAVRNVVIRDALQSLKRVSELQIKG